MSSTTKLEFAEQELLGSYVSDVGECRDVLSRTSTSISPGAFALGDSDNPNGNASPLRLFMGNYFDDNEYQGCVAQLLGFFFTEGYGARAALDSEEVPLVYVLTRETDGRTVLINESI
ncbi:hypothetical protein N7530_012713 [Penicillium desertorum]|uniref:Uncharacterized protein n=1 Tax=Penicillium desertorum TaxID=1303715 RepID=A0A9X0BFP5_9EURO|nr:hypothetical protein N7530_012713 [Penicillium desertorum]